MDADGNKGAVPGRSCNRTVSYTHLDTYSQAAVNLEDYGITDGIYGYVTAETIKDVYKRQQYSDSTS